MGDDALKLVGVVGFQNQAGVETHDPRGREGVHLLRADQQDIDVLRVDAGSPEDGLGIAEQYLLNLGVADQ